MNLIKRNIQVTAGIISIIAAAYRITIIIFMSIYLIMITNDPEAFDIDVIDINITAFIIFLALSFIVYLITIIFGALLCPHPKKNGYVRNYKFRVITLLIASCFMIVVNTINMIYFPELNIFDSIIDYLFIALLIGLTIADFFLKHYVKPKADPFFPKKRK